MHEQTDLVKLWTIHYIIWSFPSTHWFIFLSRVWKRAFENIRRLIDWPDQTHWHYVPLRSIFRTERGIDWLIEDWYSRDRTLQSSSIGCGPCEPCSEVQTAAQLAQKKKHARLLPGSSNWQWLPCSSMDRTLQKKQKIRRKRRINYWRRANIEDWQIL